MAWSFVAGPETADDFDGCETFQLSLVTVDARDTIEDAVVGVISGRRGFPGSGCGSGDVYVGGALRHHFLNLPFVFRLPEEVRAAMEEEPFLPFYGVNSFGGPVGGIFSGPDEIPILNRRCCNQLAGRFGDIFDLFVVEDELEFILCCFPVVWSCRRRLSIRLTV